METSWAYIEDLARHQDIPADGILTRTLFDAPHLKVVLFAFAEGEELSEHTASVPATLHFVQGRAALTLGTDAMEAGPGAWAHMPASLPHSIRAKTPLVMLLMMFKGKQ